MESMTPELRGLYAITDPELLPENLLLDRIEQGLKGGVRLLQYRNKRGSWSRKLDEARALTMLCHRYGVPLLINDDVRLCQESEADGVHLGQDDGDVREARRVLGANAIIGISCHNRIDLALKAEAQGVSYIAAGRFFPSRTKPDAPAASLADLRNIREQLSTPLVAIGGVNAENGASLIEAGADMLAVIHYLFATPAVQERARALNTLFPR